MNNTIFLYVSKFVKSLKWTTPQQSCEVSKGIFINPDAEHRWIPLIKVNRAFEVAKNTKSAAKYNGFAHVRCENCGHEYLLVSVEAKRKSRLAGQASALLSIMSSEEGRGIPACFRVPEFGNSPEREQWRAGGQWLCKELNQYLLKQVDFCYARPGATCME